MSNDIAKILTTHDNTVHATTSGTKMHAALAKIKISDNHTIGDNALIEKIKQNPELAQMFCFDSAPEVPIAGNINGRFVSRRIDRLYINHDTKTVYILDYKTDTTKDTFYEQYKIQLNEYANLIRQIHPTYTVKLYILWTHDWTLEKL